LDWNFSPGRGKRRQIADTAHGLGQKSRGAEPEGRAPHFHNIMQVAGAAKRILGGRAQTAGPGAQIE
jgi:hypothetical protein